MSLDKSLKSKGMLARHRNVLKRSERIELLKDAGDWPEDASPFGMPKVGHRKVSVGKKEKKKAGDADAAADGDAKTDDAST